MKKRWWVVATLLIACLIVAAWVLLQEPKGPEATLSDGTIVRFEKADVGTFQYDSYPPLKARLAGFVPNRFQSRLGERIKSTFSSQPNAVGLLFSIWTADGKRHRDLPRFFSRVEFVESTGFVFKVGVSGSSSSNNMMCFSEGPFPRRDPTLHMRFYEQGTERLLFDLHVPNPGYKSTFSEWTPETVPASQTVAPLTVTLKNGPANFTEKYLREQDLEIISTDPRWTDTRPQWHIWLTDATGNKAYDLSGLSPFEPAWKLNIRVRRNPEAEFGADEVWRTKLFALPAALEAERLNLRQVVAGLELTATVLSSAGSVQDDGSTLTVTPRLATNGGTGFGSGTNNGRAYTELDSSLPFIRLNHSTLDDDTDLIITVRDQTGRKISAKNNSGTYGMNGTSMRLVQFEPTAETTDVELEVIVNRGRTFEFLVAPPKPVPTKPAPSQSASSTDSSSSGSSTVP